MKANMKLSRADIEALLTRWAEERGWKLLGFNLKIEKGDPGDPREAGYSREEIAVEVDMDGGAVKP